MDEREKPKTGWKIRIASWNFQHLLKFWWVALGPRNKYYFRRSSSNLLTRLLKITMFQTSENSLPCLILLQVPWERNQLIDMEIQASSLLFWKSRFKPATFWNCVHRRCGKVFQNMAFCRPEKIFARLKRSMISHRDNFISKRLFTTSFFVTNSLNVCSLNQHLLSDDSWYQCFDRRPLILNIL